jgi:hypothetical protein
VDTQLQHAIAAIPRQRTARQTTQAVPPQARPGDVDERGYTLSFSGADDMGIWLTPDELPSGAGS